MKLRFSLAASAGCLGLLVTAAPAAAQPECVRCRRERPCPELAVPYPKRYSTDYSGNAIRRSSLDGVRRRSVDRGREGPYGLGFDAATGSSSDERDGRSRAGASAMGGRPSCSRAPREGFAIVVDEATARSPTASAHPYHQCDRGPADRRRAREVPWTSSSELVHGMALSAARTALYLGDDVGQ